MKIKKRIKRIEKMIKADRKQFKQFLGIYKTNLMYSEAGGELDELLKKQGSREQEMNKICKCGCHLPLKDI